MGLFLIFLIATCSFAEDWPEWRGKGRTGVFNETGILEKFPSTGLQVKWRTPVRAGYSGPAVAAGRVFVTDFETLRPSDGEPLTSQMNMRRAAGLLGKERAVAL